MFSRRPMCFLQRVISSTFSLHGLTAEPTWWAHSEWTLGKRARRRPPPAGRGAAGAGRPGSRASAARASGPSAPKRGGDPGRPKSPRGRRKTESRRFQGRGAGAARREPRARACACRSASPRRPQPQAGSVRHAEVAPPTPPGLCWSPAAPCARPSPPPTRPRRAAPAAPARAAGPQRAVRNPPRPLRNPAGGASEGRRVAIFISGVRAPEASGFGRPCPFPWAACPPRSALWSHVHAPARRPSQRGRRSRPWLNLRPPGWTVVRVRVLRTCHRVALLEGRKTGSFQV